MTKTKKTTATKQSGLGKHRLSVPIEVGMAIEGRLQPGMSKK